MSWFALLENPQALLAYYESAPQLAETTVHSLTFRRDGPVAELVFEPSVFPSSPSPRWPEGANRCQITLKIVGLSAVELSRWGTGVLGHLSISKQPHGVTLEFSGDAEFRLHGGWLYVEKVAGYVAGSEA